MEEEEATVCKGEDRRSRDRSGDEQRVGYSAFPRTARHMNATQKASGLAYMRHFTYLPSVPGHAYIFILVTIW
ncbi:hypothetical protein E2C01_018875 [Portunus trituberculatus]|uniref:Uncharacterized protein n=1 Tax=Portunus trituberculatus TaxID=210409 RepID=A0A5B7DXS0_PORTR|nr:hypothetical protein [Portunus trituberculatus]